MFTAITINAAEAEPTHAVKMVDWRTGATWTEKTVNPGVVIPQRYTPLVLDPAKIAEAQRQSDEILSDFNRR